MKTSYSCDTRRTAEAQEACLSTVAASRELPGSDAAVHRGGLAARRRARAEKATGQEDPALVWLTAHLKWVVGIGPVVLCTGVCVFCLPDFQSVVAALSARCCTSAAEKGPTDLQCTSNEGSRTQHCRQKSLLRRDAGGWSSGSQCALFFVFVWMQVRSVLFWNRSMTPWRASSDHPRCNRSFGWLRALWSLPSRLSVVLAVWRCGAREDPRRHRGWIRRSPSSDSVRSRQVASGP